MWTAHAYGADPAYAALDKAYTALRSRSYDAAISQFEAAIAVAPARASIYKDLAYTLLKVGETEAARDRFRDALRLDPGDTHVGLEYAFLCYETKQQAAARRVFDRIRRQGNATAETAFQNIDRQLSEGIARWQHAISISPDNFSAHQELASLAEQRDEADLAAEHYAAAWRLRPDQRAFLLDLGRVFRQQGKSAEAHAALLAASRGVEPRVGEAARELLPDRYPYVYEFEAAIQLDGRNAALRRELAYLLLEMGKKADAERHFREIVAIEPADLLSAAQLGFLRLGRQDTVGAMPLLQKVLEAGDPELANRVRAELKMPLVLQRRAEAAPAGTLDAKTLAKKSFEAGYLKDALKYLRIAHESDPVDFDTMLKLGWTNNILHDDRQAVEWFRLARKSPDRAIASEAERAYGNLRAGLARFHTTVWALPFYSSRWNDLFTYAQVKTETKVSSLPLRAYLTARFTGDTRRTAEIGTGNISPQYLSESAVVLGGGITTVGWKGLRAWAEAGVSAAYLKRTDGGRLRSDYRGGLSYARSIGQNMGTESQGFFGELTADALYVSRFDSDTLAYVQSKSGYTISKSGPVQLQLFWNVNLTTDLKRFYWANTWEQGPGLRFHIDGMPPGLSFSVNALQGRYLLSEDNPLGRRYTDIRAGLWYAFTR